MSISIGSAYSVFWANLFNFNGRATRGEYWKVALTAGLLGVLLAGITAGLSLIAFAVMTLALATRRLHDTGRSGWWQLIVFLPLVGTVVLMVLLALPGNCDDNRYGVSTGSASGGSILGRILIIVGIVLVSFVALCVYMAASDTTPSEPAGPSEAEREYLARAEAGDAKAQCNLGYAYAHGEGADLDFDKALLWTRKAAEQGLAEAQSNLGKMYLDGTAGEKKSCARCKVVGKGGVSRFCGRPV